MANLVTTGSGVPWYGMAVAQWIEWGGGIALLAVALSWFAPSVSEPLVSWLEWAIDGRSRAVFIGLVTLAATALALYFGWRTMGLDAAVGDEFSQRWQAHLISIGRLYARSEPHGEFFNSVETMQTEGRWFSHFPIGGPALLAIGVALHAPWLVNPLLGALAICAVYAFVSAAMSERLARRTALLCVVSPFVFFMNGTEMNHVGTLAAVWIAMAALVQWSSTHDERSRRVFAAIVGVSLGIAATIRPYDAFLSALCIGAFQLRTAIRRPECRVSFIALAIAGAVPIAALLYANWRTTGHPLLFAYDALNGSGHRPGFHMTPLGFEHTPRRGLYIISAYLLKLDVMLLAWPVPAMLLVSASLLIQRRMSEWDALLLLVLGVTLVGYWLYWGESYFDAARFLFTLAPIFLLYIARLPELLSSRISSPRLRPSFALAPLLWLLVAWSVPQRVGINFTVASLMKAFVAPRSAAPFIARQAAQARLDHALVFIPESWHGRLAARLRELGMPPLEAETLIGTYDACTIQHAVDDAERMNTGDANARLARILRAVESDPPATKLEGMTQSDQLALVAGRSTPPDCDRELSTTRSSGVTLAELLPYESLDASGALDGSVVYARDLGALNERLRARFGDRRWFIVSTQPSAGTPPVSLLPYVAPTTPR